MTGEFYSWLDEIDHELQVTMGVTRDELGEYYWYHWYNEDFSPLEALNMFFSEEMVEV